MAICPIPFAVGCEKCPAFKFCPLTTVLGDQQKEEDEIDPYGDKSASIEQSLGRKFPMTKDKRLELIKESAEKKWVDDIDRLSAVKMSEHEKAMKAWLAKSITIKQKYKDDDEGLIEALAKHGKEKP